MPSPTTLARPRRRFSSRRQIVKRALLIVLVAASSSTSGDPIILRNSMNSAADGTSSTMTGLAIAAPLESRLRHYPQPNALSFADATNHREPPCGRLHCICYRRRSHPLEFVKPSAAIFEMLIRRQDLD